MKVSAHWLGEWVTCLLAHETLAERLTMAGLEVDSISPVAPPMTGISVAKVVESTPHPDANRLSCCRVDVGQQSLVDVVCGAPNVRPGLVVAYAAPGAMLPDGRNIEQTLIRGVASAGMLCSAVELALGDDDSGLMELAHDAPVGQSLGDYLHLDDVVLDIELTPNRGDCLSIIGVAREVAVLSDSSMRTIDIAPVVATIDDELPIVIEAPEGCPRYVGRVVKNVDVSIAVPMWIKERLRRAGVRSINAVVDITNYVMLELGQPMHGFDLSQLDGGIRIRNGKNGETLALLDGQIVELTDDTLVIADHTQAVALAGVMGGGATGVENHSRQIFLESAYFDPMTLAGVARRYRLRTDASHRFERGVDFTGQERAIERATAMIIDICGGVAGPLVIAESAPNLPTRNTIQFNPEQVERVIGAKVGRDKAAKLLRAINCKVEECDELLQVTPPSFRFDLDVEADLLEEIARMLGYDTIPSTLPRAAMSLLPGSIRHERDARIRQVLISQGYYEAITYSFIDLDSGQIVTPDRTPHILSNPISNDMAVMRTSMWPGLIRAAQHNLNRQIENVRFFELGMVFDKTPEGLVQQHVLAGLAVGNAAPEQWGERLRSVDFYDIKQEVNNVLTSLNLTPSEWLADSDPALHPGQSASIKVAGVEIGKIGVLHPKIARYFDLNSPPVVFELLLESAPSMALPSYSPISKFPSVRRDISVVFDEKIAAAEVLDTVRTVAGGLLRDLQLFDEYRGQGIDSDKKSLTIGLIFQAHSSTLTDEEIEETMKRVLMQLYDDFGGTLRN